MAALRDLLHGLLCDHTPEPVNFGIIHVGDSASQALSLANLAPNDGFSESLNASFSGTTGDATAAGSFNLLTAGANDNASLTVGVDTSSAGLKVGTATISLNSDGTGTSRLGITALASQTVNIQVQVNNFANPVVSMLSGDGAFMQNSAT